MTLSEELRAFVARVEQLEILNLSQQARIEELESQSPPAPGPSTALQVHAEGYGNVEGAEIPLKTRLRASTAGKSKWVLNGSYVGTFDYGWVDLNLLSGENKLRVRSEDNSVDFTVRFIASDSSSPAPDPVVQEPSVPDEPAPVPPSDTGPRDFKVIREVRVTNRAELVAAIASHKPGDKINLDPGNYGASSPLVIKTNGPLWICGPKFRGAIFDKGSSYSGYNIHLDNANDLILEGITLRGGQKGLMCDETNRALISNCDIGNTGHEAVHFRNNSCDNVLQFSDVHDTGQTSASYGEGVYLGQSVNNWNASTSRTNGGPDRSDRNRVLGNSIWNTTAECIDIKEGTSDGIIRANVLGGQKISGANSADSYIDVKGNGYLIEDNTAGYPSTKVVHGFETHILVSGWGDANIFSRNKVQAGGLPASLGYNIQVSGSRGKAENNKVHGSNQATEAPAGLTNITIS